MEEYPILYWYFRVEVHRSELWVKQIIKIREIFSKKELYHSKNYTSGKNGWVENIRTPRRILGIIFNITDVKMIIKKDRNAEEFKYSTLLKYTKSKNIIFTLFWNKLIWIS